MSTAPFGVAPRGLFQSLLQQSAKGSRHIPMDFHDPRRRPGRIVGTLFNVALMMFLMALSLSSVAALGGNAAILAGLGLIGIWRHGWGIINFARAILYLEKDARKPAVRLAAGQSLVVIVTVYNQTNEEVKAVATSLAQSIQQLPNKTLVVFAHRTDAQRDIMQAVADATDKLSVHYIVQRGLGKREALASSLTRARSIVSPLMLDHYNLLLMDGDTIVTGDAILKSMTALQENAKTGAVVVNEIPFVKGNAAFGTWRLLRSYQRNKLMCSFALSDRTLVLTGRFAMLRAEILLQVDVINRIRKDYLQLRGAHIPLLTGDDKTTWLEVLRRGYGMTYLPRAFVYPIENPDMERGFMRGVLALTTRYSGNMARANLHPDAWQGVKGKTHFAYGLIDQRVSMWTSLITPLLLVYLFVFGDFELFVLLLTYTLLIKNIQAIVVSINSGDDDPRFPYLIFFDQVAQSMIKVRAFAYLHQQTWNNQGISLSSGKDTLELDAKASRALRMRVTFFALILGYVYVLMR